MQVRHLLFCAVHAIDCSANVKSRNNRYCKRTGCAGPSADETGMCRIGSAAWSKITALQQDLFRASDQINAVMKVLCTPVLAVAYSLSLAHACLPACLLPSQKWPRMGDMPSINARLSPLLRRIKDALDRAGTLGPVTPNVLGIGREILQSFAVLKQDVKTWMGSSAAVEASVGVLDEDLQTSQNVLVNGETLFSSIRSGKQCLVQILQEVWDLQEVRAVSPWFTFKNDCEESHGFIRSLPFTPPLSVGADEVELWQ
jgi:hypothetical protein